jgi:hypothetical protein
MSYCFRLINRAASARATSLGARALSSSPATTAAGGEEAKTFVYVLLIC